MRDIKSFVDAGVIGHFPGGIHPPERKSPANTVALRRPPLPSELILPLRQHIGPSGQCSVEVGDKVLKGQQLTEAQLSQGLPLHAPTSGTVIAIEERPMAHASGLPELAIVIQPDGEDRWITRQPLPNYRDCDRATLIETIQKAGIAGLGGAGFPTAQKLASQKPIQYLIINGVECEPYICADDRLMCEHAIDIVAGIEILQFISNAGQVLLAIEDNKPEAIAAMREAIDGSDSIKLRVIPTKYPSGGEKQLIELLTGQQVPQGQLPLDIGLLMQNTGTAYAVKRAVIDGEPLLERVVTLTGDLMSQPGNVWALLGTPIAHLLAEGGFNADDDARVIMGGPMMGFTLPLTDVPVIKTTNCILTPSLQELPPAADEMACIRCGACADVCPATLQPQQLQWLAKAKDYDALESNDLFDCIECGACAYVCPSEIPLVHYYRKAKAEIRNIAREKAKAELARQRFERRQERLEREKQERLERHRKAAEARKKMQQEKAATETSDAASAANKPAQDKSSAVAAAIARAKAKKAAQQAANNTSDEENS
ncbi:MAG: electron transport complex subunit RsxC [Idiomarina sp.]|uniref:electron transport complex subunit RsxC n=1 Tax=Idiomarina sp. TaxID=1874361 RepID=UPI000C3E78D0|nr:electron transport complex subunit RsxC [Idiomarina sp.]MBT43306.1 electron transport complex subunit RsxC [Idiomarina sp.]